MNKRRLVYLHFPCRIVVCDNKAEDKVTRDLIEYARIIPMTKEIGGIWLTRFEFAWQIEWTKHKEMLTLDEIFEIERFASNIAEQYKEETEKAKSLQAYQLEKYACKIAIEEN